ncbi:hypothetical protein SAMN03159341_1376 [Paenibacillus sp. 1_12]|uniref:hypothetical protein n=1 Tax=Paenibacillus sp. 1_12 TaxID=1566278 RepID=UPI0008E23C53|nr:hypothetical protein [Paenibacillus sp. 1_12]SFM48143.1 hypothetical protein SAMN03159341_1376 [Paenibacillus sp. 1_12]
MTKEHEGLAGKGRPSNYTDEQLKELVLDIKKKYKGQKLTYLFLEKETGIGRNTWSRRIPETIDVLNNPVPRSIGVSESDDVYFPNIEQIFDLYKNDKNKIINELYFIETAFYELYNTVNNLKEELNRRKDDSAELKMKNDEIILLQEQVKHYEQLYNQQMVSSAFSHLQSQSQAKENLIQFNKNNRNHVSLENLESFFETNGSNTSESNTSLTKMENRFGNIFKKDH